MSIFVNGIPVDGHRAVESVYEFNRIAQVRPPGQFDADRVGFHTGMQLEELAEKIKAIATGCVISTDRAKMLQFAAIMDTWGEEFKSGKHHGDVLRADREEMLDGDIDVLVVTLGALMYQTPRWMAAIGTVLAANAEKVPGGVAVRDQNGKIQKPPGWKKPYLMPFVQQPID